MKLEYLPIDTGNGVIWNRLFDTSWAMLWFFLFAAWIWLTISVVSDLFGSKSSGPAKAGWVILILPFPFLGVLIYLLVNGDSMHERAVADLTSMGKAQRDYIREAAGTGPSTSN
ncbi:MAG TPA: PLDc_N domain-containing protein [Acidimicrobiales bacterium]|nr:PLDc_N domain-containing protein [Acidimicrobiales bacterium]